MIRFVFKFILLYYAQKWLIKQYILCSEIKKMGQLAKHPLPH